MSWDVFCRVFKVPYHYQLVSLDNLSIYGPDFCEKIAFDFIKRPINMVIMGDVGRGKTYFTLALIKELMETRMVHVSDIKWFNADMLDMKISDEIKREGSPTNFLNQLCDVDYLFIDDFGVEGSRERAERNYYKLLDRRLSDNKITVISTNLTNTEILEIFGARIESRLSQCTKLIFNGEDLRKKGF